MFERLKKFRALDRAAIGTGRFGFTFCLFLITWFDGGYSKEEAYTVEVASSWMRGDSSILTLRALYSYHFELQLTTANLYSPLYISY